jgi:hypothetical protein
MKKPPLTPQVQALHLAFIDVLDSINSSPEKSQEAQYRGLKEFLEKMTLQMEKMAVASRVKLPDGISDERYPDGREP